MNILKTDFNWISFLVVIVVTIIGIIRSNAKKAAPEPLFRDEPESDPEEDMMSEVANRFKDWKQEREEVQFADSELPGDSYRVPEKAVSNKSESPIYSSSSEEEQDNYFYLDIRQAVISSEILRRPEW